MTSQQNVSLIISTIQNCFGKDSYSILKDLPEFNLTGSSAPEYFVYMREYLNEAAAHLTRNSSSNCELTYNALLNNLSLAIHCLADYDHLLDDFIELNHTKFSEVRTQTEYVAVALGAVNKALNHYHKTFDTSLESYIGKLAAIIYCYLELTDQ